MIDFVLVRRDVQGRLDLPDDWVAAAILATMGYAVASVLIAALRAFVTGGRTLWSQSRQSQFRAGLVAASGFILAIAGGLLLLGFHAALKARVDQDPVVISVHSTPASSSSSEELRLMLKQIAAPSQRLSATSSVPGMGMGPGRTENFSVGSKTFAQCIDTFLDKTSKRDFVGEWSSNLSGRFGLSLFDARGLVLDTLLSVCSKKADDPDNLSGYFQRALTNAVRSYYKQRNRGQTRQCEFELVYVLSQGEPIPSGRRQVVVNGPP